MRKTIIKLYKARGGWRWSMKDQNGKVIGASTEGYRRRIDAVKNLLRVSKAGYYGPIE